ncbi:glycoside hydrolase family 19 protein [Pseudomonas kurunegalensis]|uniref:glycoside hydrolase family 19 protein n=1 Tax=Pseudomonas kurunegalensis TaxID=485880 RepID=UPI00256FB7BF|nr:glycoside hydrolase family 19 protein [Pseudomonas kurunegalensis]WJD63703.1 glycoside hydrolase family 19 protein [Pseudomonas kurunegalensis]
MCISNTVGDGGKNLPADVRSLQFVLKLNSGKHGEACGLATDGLWGSASRGALKHFQQGAGVVPRALVAPGDQTMVALRRGLPPGLTVEKMRIIMTTASASRVAEFYQPILDVLARYAIDTPLRIAHFLAQIAHESGCLLYTEELASGAAYEWRTALGNTQKGDGARFKGRGLIQLTGRANYRQYGLACHRDFESRDAPELVSTDRGLAVDVAGWFWKKNNLNDLADADNVEKVTRKINGGVNGLIERTAYLERAKWLLVN